MAESSTVNELLDGHVALDLECLDRIYLNGYVLNLQVAGQVVRFMTQHLGYPIPSPAIMEKMGTAFRYAVTLFAQANHIPVVRFHKGDRKIDVIGRYLAAQAAAGRSAVGGAIGMAQEYRNVRVRGHATRPLQECPVVPVHQGGPAGVVFLKPPAPLELRRALTTIDRHIHAYTTHARLGKAA
jgi:hypothetical protein